jgi:hypothetical protein
VGQYAQAGQRAQAGPGRAAYVLDRSAGLAGAAVTARGWRLHRTDPFCGDLLRAGRSESPWFASGPPGDEAPARRRNPRPATRARARARCTCSPG